MTFAIDEAMRRWLVFVLGIIVGQWLAFGAMESPAGYHVRAQHAWEHRDYLEAMRLWSHAVSLQPGDPTFQYLRGTALAKLGLRMSAIDAFQVTLLLDPSPTLTRSVFDELNQLNRPSATTVQETAVPLEHGLGVWIAAVTVNDARTGRFLVDTGSSVTVLSPALAAGVGITGGSDGGSPVELQTLGGKTAGPSAIATSIRVGDQEVRDAPVVLHDPGSGLDGILGNTFLSRYRVTIDADRRLLVLRQLAGE